MMLDLLHHKKCILMLFRDDLLKGMQLPANISGA